MSERKPPAKKGKKKPTPWRHFNAECPYQGTKRRHEAKQRRNQAHKPL